MRELPTLTDVQQQLTAARVNCMTQNITNLKLKSLKNKKNKKTLLVLQLMFNTKQKSEAQLVILSMGRYITVAG